MNTSKFELCCDKPICTSYSLEHSPKPIRLPLNLLSCIEMLLWYIPNISSIQSKKSELISETLYDDFCFQYILKETNLSDKDVLLIEKSDDISSELISYYDDSICTNCQKLILKKGSNKETKTQTLLRHIRNSIAHGSFNLCDDTLISFDVDPSSRKTTAIIKIKPEALLQVLSIIDSGITKEALFKYAFEKIGYKTYQAIAPIHISPSNYITPDLIIEKGNRKYVIEIKVYKSRFINSDYIIEQMKHYMPLVYKGFVPVLILDKSKLTVSGKEKLNNDHFKIIDISSAKDLLSGNDVLL
ncbi:MAG: hypothetical protein ACI4JG_06020 [Acutalibacteraceae bacterium]